MIAQVEPQLPERKSSLWKLSVRKRTRLRALMLPNSKGALGIALEQGLRVGV